MLINMTAEGNVNVKNLVQTLVQHPAFRDTINSILTATNQGQSTNIVLIASAGIPEREGWITTIQLLQATARLLVTRDKFIYLQEMFFFLFLE